MITFKQKHILAQSSQSGFTIAESLMAMVVAAILMAAIAPVIVLSVATRVQARRIELASQAARAYIDGVRAGTIAAPSSTVTLNEVNTTNTTKPFTSQRNLFATVAAPTSSGSLSCNTSTVGYPYCQNTTAVSLYCIDGDGGGCSNTSVQDLVVQAFRTTNDKNYILAVRVYRADAFSSSDSLLRGDNPSNNNIGGAQATFTGGLGKLKAPLAQMVVDMTDSRPQYRDYCDRLGGCNS